MIRCWNDNKLLIVNGGAPPLEQPIESGTSVVRYAQCPKCQAVYEIKITMTRKKE